MARKKIVAFLGVISVSVLAFVSLLPTKLFAAAAEPAKASLSQSGPVDKGGLAEILAEALEERATRALERFGLQGDFIVRAEVKVSTPWLEIPYLTDKPTARSLATMPASQLAKSLDSATFDIVTSKIVSPAERDGIRAMLTKALRIDLSAANALAFTQIAMPPKVDDHGNEGASSSAQSSQSERTAFKSIEATQAAQSLQVAQAAQAERSEMSRQLDAAKSTEVKVRAERNDLKQELTVANSEIDRLGRELAAQSSALEVSRSQTKLSWLERLKLNWMAVAGVIVGVIAFMLFVFAFERSGKRVSEAVSAMASSLGKQLTNRTEVLSSGSERSNGSSEQGGSGATTSSRAASLAAIPRMPLEALHARLEYLQKEILAQFNPRKEGIILRHLLGLLANPDLVSRAVVSMELLGRDKANQLFHRLTPEGQDSVMLFLRGGSYNRSKNELMLEAGEEMVTKLMGADLGQQRINLSQEVADRLLRLKDQDLLRCFNSFDGRFIPRLAHYMDASQLAGVLQSLRKVDKPRFEKVVTLLTRLPEAENDQAADKDLLGLIDAELTRVKSDLFRPYLKLFKELIKSTDQDVSEDIAASLVAASPDLEQHLRSELVTVRTLFVLPEALKAEVLSALNNMEIGALTLSYADQSKDILRLISKRRLEMIMDDQAQLKEVGALQIDGVMLKARSKIIAAIRKYQERGLLDIGALPAVPRQQVSRMSDPVDESSDKGAA